MMVTTRVHLVQFFKFDQPRYSFHSHVVPKSMKQLFETEMKMQGISSDDGQTPWARF